MVVASGVPFTIVRPGLFLAKGLDGEPSDATPDAFEPALGARAHAFVDERSLMSVR